MAFGVDGRAGPDTGEDFAGLYAEMYQPLVAYCRQLTGYSDPEDLAQEALVRAWRAWPRYAGGGSMWPLVITIARRIWIDEYRKSSRGHLRSHLERQYSDSQAPSPEEALERREQGATARHALSQLPARYQRMIQLRDIDERSYVDIARLEGTTLAGARTAMRRARAALRAAYGRAGEGAAAALGLAGWAGRKFTRLHAAVEPAAHQGLTTLAGAAMALAIASGVGGHIEGPAQTTASPPASARFSDATLAGNAGADPTGTGAAGGAGADGPPPGGSDEVPNPDVPDPDHVVGPVGVGGDDYGRDRTKDAELRPEVKVGDTVIFGFYASPREVLADPTRPLRDE